MTAVAGTPVGNTTSIASTNNFGTSIATALGSSVFALVFSPSNNDIVSLTGTVNGAYTFLDNEVDSSVNLYQMSSFLVQDCASGTDVLTVVRTIADTQYGIIAIPATGVMAAALDGHNSNVQLTPTTGANAITSNAPGNSNAPGLLISGAYLFGSALTADAPPFTDNGTFAGSSTYSGLFRIESQRIASGSAPAATYTGNNNSTAFSFCVYLDELVAQAALLTEQSNQGGF